MNLGGIPKNAFDATVASTRWAYACAPAPLLLLYWPSHWGLMSVVCLRGGGVKFFLLLFPHDLLFIFACVEKARSHTGVVKKQQNKIIILLRRTSWNDLTDDPLRCVTSCNNNHFKGRDHS